MTRQGCWGARGGRGAPRLGRELLPGSLLESLPGLLYLTSLWANLVPDFPLESLWLQKGL